MMNLVTLFGRLTDDPKLSSKEDGGDNKIWCSFRLAVGRDRKKEGEDTADFFPCILFGRSASYLARYGMKGGRVIVQGKLRTGTVDNSNGSRSIYTQVIVDRLWIIDYRQDTTYADSAPRYDPSADPERFENVPGPASVPFLN